MSKPNVRRRPWRLERVTMPTFQKAPARWQWEIVGTFATRENAQKRIDWLTATFPNRYPDGTLRVEKHVDFEARS